MAFLCAFKQLLDQDGMSVGPKEVDMYPYAYLSLVTFVVPRYCGFFQIFASFNHQK